MQTMPGPLQQQHPSPTQHCAAQLSFYELLSNAQPEVAVDGVAGEAAANCRGSSTASVICMIDDAQAGMSACTILATPPMPFNCR